MKLLHTALTLIPFLLSGCGLASFDTEVRELVAPDVVMYSQGRLDQVASEIEGGQCNASSELLKDYCVLRDQARILNSEKPICAVKP